MIKLVAFDLDGTLTQHKSPLEDENRAVLTKLQQKYRLVMVGAGSCERIFAQMGHFPIDIIGNYGMQETRYDAATDSQIPVRSVVAEGADRKSVSDRITALREQFGYTQFVGENVEFHNSGAVTFPLLGTAAKLPEKLAFDPDRTKRRKIYDTVAAAFPEYRVFVGGTSSFDMAPKPYCKSFALLNYCAKLHILPEEVAFCGDDYGLGGNDADIAETPIRFIRVDDYRKFGDAVRELFAD